MNDILYWLKEHNHYLILTHARPDGDTLGSAAALCEGLRHLGKTAYVQENPETTERYIPFVKNLYPPEGFAWKNVIAVDAASRQRLPEAHREIQVDFAIDHHLAHIDFAPLRYIDAGSAACGEIVYQILSGLGVPMTPEIAMPLYVSIATDTGCFRFSNTTARTHEITAELLKTGIDVSPVNWVLFDQKTRPRLQVEARIYETMRFYREDTLAMGILDRAIIRETGATEDDLDSLSALPRRVAGVEIGVLLHERSVAPQPQYKISIRTSKQYRADLIAGHLGGGGHARAAGATVDATLDEVILAVLEAVQASL